MDEDAYRGYQWTIDNDPTDQGLYFCIDVDYFGKAESKELVPGGEDLAVNQENKLEYLEKLGHFKLYIAIKE